MAPIPQHHVGYPCVTTMFLNIRHRYHNRYNTTRDVMEFRKLFEMVKVVSTRYPRRITRLPKVQHPRDCREQVLGLLPRHPDNIQRVRRLLKPIPIRHTLDNA